MSETIPGYGRLPSPPKIDVLTLRSRIAMYLHGQAGDEQYRNLLEEAGLALMQADHGVHYWQDLCDTAIHNLAKIDGLERRQIAFQQRLEPILRYVESCISDGK